MSKASPERWDDLEIPIEALASKASVDAWIVRSFPPDDQHHYVLWTDGSGCTKGWGAQAAVFMEVDSEESDVRVSSTYGSTVRRCEMGAFLDGVHGIMDHHLRRIESLRAYEKDPLSETTGTGRITISWYTDRRELAMCLLYKEGGTPVYARKKDKDLWMRWQAMARHVCVTPRPIERNTVPYQAWCDKLCTIARQTGMSFGRIMQGTTPSNLSSKLWKNNMKRPQSAVF